MSATCVLPPRPHHRLGGVDLQPAGKGSRRDEAQDAVGHGSASASDRPRTSRRNGWSTRWASPGSSSQDTVWPTPSGERVAVQVLLRHGTVARLHANDDPQADPRDTCLARGGRNGIGRTQHGLPAQRHHHLRRDGPGARG